MHTHTPDSSMYRHRAHTYTQNKGAIGVFLMEFTLLTPTLLSRKRVQV